jgi:hypothetical protein
MIHSEANWYTGLLAPVLIAAHGILPRRPEKALDVAELIL